MATKKLFSPQEIEALRQNPYTLAVTEGTIRFTLPFKQEFMNRYNSGQAAARIFADLGYDADVLGKCRVKSFASHLRAEAASRLGLHEGNNRRGRHVEVPDYAGMPEDMALARMQRELLYLRQELEFIKKIIKADEQGGRR
jgi:hypothetical protein